MELEIRIVSTRRDLHKFIHLPEKIHAEHPGWVPPIYLDDWNFFNPRKNKSFEYCDTVLTIALKQGRCVGRIMGIINHKYNESHGENDARFCFMETWNDQEVYHQLIGFIEDWARKKGKDKLVGPLAFSDKDPQ